ncbi:MAG: MBL fold metallo-hydrolase [Sulfitobacter sp.]|nr:MBL fold metallo-hydrolase [Sulfitobacter sp.]
MLPPDDFNPAVGEAETLEPGLRRIVAPNPSPMTYRGTNTYILGKDQLCVIDPGPDDRAHLEAILRAIGPDRPVSHIVVTHTHLDHSPLARPLAQATGAPVLAYGDATAGRSEIMQELASAGEIGGGEGIDLDFEPDAVLRDDEVIEGDGWHLRALHTPGHIGNHLSLAWNDRLFSADHVMGWATSLVSPPDGDLTDFMASCARLRSEDWHRFYPGHGGPIEDPGARLDWLVSHRRGREASILESLQLGPSSATAIAARVYTETPPALLGAATRNVLAHLVDLTVRGHVEPTETLHAEAVFRVT